MPSAPAERPAPRARRPLPSVSVVIPVRDSAGLPPLLRSLGWGVRPVADEVIVVTAGPDDDDAVLAAYPEALLVRAARPGLGNALACGFAAATGDVVVALDAGGATDPGELPRYVSALVAGADVALGSRYRAGGRDLTAGRFRRRLNLMLIWLVNVLYQVHRTDPGFGYTALWRDVVDRLGLPDPSPAAPAAWGDGPEIQALITVRTAARGLTVTEVPGVAYPRMRRVAHADRATGWHWLRALAAEFRGRTTRRARHAARPATPTPGTDRATLPATSTPTAGQDGLPGVRPIASLPGSGSFPTAVSPNSDPTSPAAGTFPASNAPTSGAPATDRASNPDWAAEGSAVVSGSGSPAGNERLADVIALPAPREAAGRKPHAADPIWGPSGRPEPVALRLAPIAAPLDRAIGRARSVPPPAGTVAAAASPAETAPPTGTAAPAETAVPAESGTTSGRRRDGRGRELGAGGTAGGRTTGSRNAAARRPDEDQPAEPRREVGTKRRRLEAYRQRPELRLIEGDGTTPGRTKSGRLRAVPQE